MKVTVVVDLLVDETDGAWAVVDGVDPTDGLDGAAAVSDGRAPGDGVAGAVTVVVDVEPGDGVAGAAALGEELTAGQGDPFDCSTWPGRQPPAGGEFTDGWEVDGDADGGVAESGALCARAGADNSAAHAAANKMRFMECLRRVGQSVMWRRGNGRG
jgi:hypothetical protein